MSAAAKRFVVCCGILPTLLTAFLCVTRPPVLTGLEYSVHDRLVRWAGTAPTADRVVIVDVDEASLDTVGQWPWPRTTIGTLIDRLRDAGAAVVALDIMFAEADRQLQPANGDVALADTLRGGRVVLGYALTFDGADSAANRPCAQHPVALAIIHGPDEGPNPGEPFFRASKAICNVDTLTAAAAASGFLNAAPDFDGILRRVPLLLEFQGRVYPSLALTAVSAAVNMRPTALRVANVNDATLILTDSDRTAASNEVPLDGRSNLLVRYRGGKRTFPYVSAVDVLNGNVRSEQFADKIAFVGTTALGTREVVATPLDTLFTGIEVQATVADNLLRRDFFRRPPEAVALEALAVVLMGLAAALLTALRGLWLGAAAGAVVTAAAWGLSTLALSRYGLLLSPLYPSIAVAGAVAAMTTAGVALERRRAESACRAQVASQRLMVQTLLSLVEMRDQATGRHSRRTQHYTRLLADRLWRHPRFNRYLTPQRLELVSALAPLHDIGKVAVPDAILNKPGALTASERAEIRNHPAYGREVIENAEQAADVRDDLTLAIAKDIVYSHHEKWDGTGYPQGLVGDRIPIPGRLVALVDVYDAMRSQRPYHAPRSHDDVLRLIVAERGKHFDPDVVDAFIRASEDFRAASEEAEVDEALDLPTAKPA